MTSQEMIIYLRALASYGTQITRNDQEVFALAADRLEQLEERVAIMSETDG